MRTLGLDKITIHRHWLTVLTVVLLVASQALTAAHASGHPFHNGDGNCMVLSLAEKHSSLPAHVQPRLLAGVPLQLDLVPRHALSIGIQPRPYQSRAPPAIRLN